MRKRKRPVLISPPQKANKSQPSKTSSEETPSKQIRTASATSPHESPATKGYAFHKRKTVVKKEPEEAAAEALEEDTMEEVAATESNEVNEEAEEEEDLECEDPYGDEVEEEEIVEEGDEDNDAEAEEVEEPKDENMMEDDSLVTPKIEEDEDEQELPLKVLSAKNLALQRKVFKPGDTLEEGEELEPDNSAYDMLHRMTTDWPYLSFDILRDGLGSNRTKAIIIHSIALSCSFLTPFMWLLEHKRILLVKTS